MDYEQLYTYLESRPLKEQKDCMHRIVQLVRRQCSESEIQEIEKLFHLRDEDSRNANRTSTTQHRSQITEQFWTQQAVWNKFGDPNIEHTSFDALTLATAPLFMKITVAQYLVAKNKLIDEVSFSKKDETQSNQNHTTIVSSKLAPPNLTVPKAHSTTQHTSYPHSKSFADNTDKPECAEQIGDLLRPIKRVRENASSRFDDKDMRFLSVQTQSPPHNPPNTTPRNNNITNKSPAFQDNGAAEGKEGGSSKKLRRAGFFE